MVKAAMALVVVLSVCGACSPTSISPTAEKLPSPPTNPSGQPPGSVTATPEVTLMTLFDDVPSGTHASIPSDATVIRSRLVQVNFDLLKKMLTPPKAGTIQGKILLNLFEDTSYTAILDTITSAPPNRITWTGHLEGVPNSHVTFVIEGDVMSGNISSLNSLYQVRYIREGIHAIYQINQAAFPPDEPPGTPTPSP